MSSEDLSNKAKWEMLASPYESITSAIESAGQVTAATSRIIAQCFSCFRKKESPSCDGAWFDSEQLQIENPYCYDNPVAMSPHVEITEIAPLEMPLDDVIKDSKSAKILTVTTNKSVNPTTELFHELNSPRTKRPKFRKHRQRLSQNSTFVSKLEADHCHGYRNEARTRSQSTNHKPSIRSPILQRKNIPPINIDFVESLQFWEDSDDEKDFKDVFGEVWKPSELKEVFEFYNDFAFQSFSQPSLNTSQSFKKNGDKFDDFFPINGEKLLDNGKLSANNDRINNNSIKLVINKNLNQWETRTSRSINHKLLLSNEGKRTFDSKNDVCVLTVEETMNFVEICIFVQDFEELDKYKNEINNSKFFCDKLFSFGNKKLSRKLIFNLVKQIMDSYLIEYKSSLALSLIYPVNYVQKKVLNILQCSDTELCSVDKLIIAEDILAVRKRMQMNCSIINIVDKERYDPEEKLVVSVVTQEIKNEHLDWQNFEEEEKRTKISVAEEIYQDLLRKELKIIEMILLKKRINLL